MKLPEPNKRAGKRKDYTTGQVAKMCGVAPRTVTLWVDSGRLWGYRLPIGDPSVEGTSPSSKARKSLGDRRVPHRSLVRFLQAHDMPMFGLDAESVRILFVAAPECFRTRIMDVLGDDYVAYDAKGVFSAGVQVGRVDPHCVVVDFAVGRNEAKSIADEAASSGVGSVYGCVNEDESDEESLKGAGFCDTFRKPVDEAKFVASVVSRLKTVKESRNV